MDRVFVWNEKASSPVGPFDRTMLSNLIEKGLVRRETLVAADGEQEWTNAADHPATAFWLAPEPSSRPTLEAPPPPPPRPEQLYPTEEAEPIRHAAYDPDYELEILDLNPGSSHRSLRDYSLLAGGLNILAISGLILLPVNPVSMLFLFTLFIGGNVSLAWIYGVVLR